MSTIYEVQNDEYVPENNTEDCCPKDQGEMEKKKFPWKDAIALGVGLCVDTTVTALLKAYVPVPTGTIKRIATKVGIIAISGAVTGWVSDMVKKDISDVEETVKVVKVTIHKVTDDGDNVVINEA